MKYPRGFIDPHRQHFYSNGGKSHRKNAEEVIEKRGWKSEWEKDTITCNEAPDFLIFRKGFIQIGSGNSNIIAVSDQLYGVDFHNTRIWRAIRKSLTVEEAVAVDKEYIIIKMTTPKF